MTASFVLHLYFAGKHYSTVPSG